ncbi:MAG: hypothetical protein KAS95_05780 [Candidatus Heimdallarchaeota archaeon]|nr:hypothetical protein [Candidatus Heimdallarchaeota archaeon]
MTSVDLSAEKMLRQRKKFEALGGIINKSSGMKSWLKVLFGIVLIFGIPTLLLLSDPYKDGIIILYQIATFGFRMLLVAMTIFMTMKITTFLLGAKNDQNFKMMEIGYKDSETNTKAEKKLIMQKIMFSIIQIMATLGSLFGVFLVSSRNNYGYIIGQELILGIILLAMALTFRFWSSKGPDYSPRMGGRILVLTFIPSMFIWSLEIMVGLFSVLGETNFPFNTQQISWSITYPLIFAFLFAAVLYTTRKTKREKLLLQDARLAEFNRREKLIYEKNWLKRLNFKTKTFFENIRYKVIKEPKDSEKNLDKKPNPLVINSIWITLFITIIPVAFILPWNLFAHDGIMIFAALIVSYEYSQLKYNRYELKVIYESEKDEEIFPTPIRTTSMTDSSYRGIMIVSVIFIVAQFLLSGILTTGDLSKANIFALKAFTWMSALIVLPVVLQTMILLQRNTDENRSNKNLDLYKKSLLYILIIEVFIIIAAVIGSLLGQGLGFEYILSESIWLFVIVVALVVIVPLLFSIVVPYLSDQNYKTAKILTYALILAAYVGTFTWFIFDIIISYFFTTL